MAMAPKERAEISDDEEWVVARGVRGVSEIAQPDVPGPETVEVTLRRLANTINEQQEQAGTTGTREERQWRDSRG